MSGKKGKKKKSRLLARRGMNGYVFCLPVIIGLVFLFLPALVTSLYYSFHTVTIGLGAVETEFIGWENYTSIITDTTFITLLVGAARGIVFDTACIILFSFFMANVLNQEFVGRGFARMIFFLPVVVAMGVVADLEAADEAFNLANVVETTSTSSFEQLGMTAIFQAQRLLSIMGLPSSLSDIVASVTSGMYDILNASGVQILLMLSALQSINPSVFEAAKMEGASVWESFWKITFPMLLPTVLVCVIYSIIATFTNPNYGILEYVQTKAFSTGKMGYASALAWVYFVIVIVVIGVVAGIISRRVTYFD